LNFCPKLHFFKGKNVVNYIFSKETSCLHHQNRQPPNTLAGAPTSPDRPTTILPTSCLCAVINIVWFKRDLRLQDHAPLQAALAEKLPVLLLHCFEPSWMACPDSDPRHWRFVRQSVDEMTAKLASRGIPFYSFHAEILDVLVALGAEVPIQNLFSHTETGNRHTYDRDVAVARFCERSGIAWHESPTNGVHRRLYHRQNWEKKFVERMSQPLADPDWQRCRPYTLPASFIQKFRATPLPEAVLTDHPLFQPGGENAAHRYLDSFLYERKSQYFKNISKPEAARRSCSRLSPYLAWGNLSTRQVFQATQRAVATTGDRYNLGQFTSRLFWQSHFVQKFETECRMEFENLNRGFDLIRRDTDPERVSAWQEGRTGFPLVDACMRCVVATGYLNFRMRSMLVSFLTHHLWQPWQAGAHHLARQFLDYEPGIHYAQFQMQAGTMGVNTIRIYNPVKQSLEHDPDGIFIKKWLPELAHLPVPFVHEPWKMTALDAAFHHFQPGADYPLPIVDLARSHAAARDQLWAHRQHEQVLAENKRVLRVHTKRKKAEETTVVGDAGAVRRLLGK